VSSLSLPGPVQNVQESCPPAASAPAPTPAPTTSSTTPQSNGGGNGGGNGSTPTTTTSKPKTPGHGPPPPPKPNPKNATKPSPPKPGAPKPAAPAPAPAKPAPAKPAPARTLGGVPTPANPSFSLALPGPAAIGVPNFFIASFQIPPFLLPIYQAAGIEYDVPWQVLAAINEIETDYGRNLSVSSAGAVGWMQFIPSTWKAWAVDANGDGVADPYNPVDAIFTAARYLHAAGASKNLGGAVFEYNHADWYVQSVLLRAKLIGGMPNDLIGALTGLVQAHFPVAAKAKYADDAVLKLAGKKVKSGNAAIPVSSDPNSSKTSIYADRNSPVIAVNDGKIVGVGHNDPKLGNYVELQDATGNVYTYAQLGSIPNLYPVPNPVRLSPAQVAKELSSLPPTKTPKVTGPATAGSQQAPPTVSTAKATKEAKASAPITLPVSPQPAAQTTISAPLAKERLFAYPNRPAAYAAGGKQQLAPAPPQITDFQNYFSDVLHLAKNQYTLKPLKPGAIVVGGTILGRLGPGTPTNASHVDFMIRPAGKAAPYIDPKPILDGWKLLEATAVYRAAGVSPFFGPKAKNPTVGQVLLMSKEQLTNRVLNDPRVSIYACGQRDIEAGSIDVRVLRVIEFLSASGLDPTVSGLKCGNSLTGSTGVDAAGATGESVDISAINNIPVKGHQNGGSVTDMAVRRLLTLQGAMKPTAIVSLMSYKGQNNAVSLPDHANRIQVSYSPLYGQNKQLSNEIKSALTAPQWIQLINRISAIPEPVVPIAASNYAIKLGGAH
jgi:Transglycosylase SLT domain